MQERGMMIRDHTELLQGLHPRDDGWKLVEIILCHIVLVICVRQKKSKSQTPSLETYYGEDVHGKVPWPEHPRFTNPDELHKKNKIMSTRKECGKFWITSFDLKVKYLLEIPKQSPVSTLGGGELLNSS
jgi:hypothetical protein